MLNLAYPPVYGAPLSCHTTHPPTLDLHHIVDAHGTPRERLDLNHTFTRKSSNVAGFGLQMAFGGYGPRSISQRDRPVVFPLFP